MSFLTRSAWAVTARDQFLQNVDEANSDTSVKRHSKMAAPHTVDRESNA